jgi:hypothetical protein
MLWKLLVARYDRWLDPYRQLCAECQPVAFSRDCLEMRFMAVEELR